MVPPTALPRRSPRFRPVLRPASLSLLLLALWLHPAGAARTDCPGSYFGGVAPDIVSPKVRKEARELCYSSFGVVHSGVSRTPLWSAEHLTRGALSAAKDLVRVDSFHAEERLPPEDRAELSDYARSGYDRGHMAPNGDMPDRRSQHESFSLANIVPQDRQGNRGVWQGIESAVRALAKRRGELYVVTGPIFRGASVKRIGGRVLVPTHLYKVVYDPREGKGAAYLVENGPTEEYAVVTVAELEEMAGIDFFPSLDPAAKREPLSLPKPSRKGGRRGKGRGGDGGGEGLVKEIESLLR